MENTSTASSYGSKEESRKLSKAQPRLPFRRDQSARKHKPADPLAPFLKRARISKPSPRQSGTPVEDTPPPAGSESPLPEATRKRRSYVRPKVPHGTVKLMIAGDLVLPQNVAQEKTPFFTRFEALFENLAQRPKSERMLLYKFITALGLSSYAKKAADVDAKKHLFDLKNEIIVDIANSPEYRGQIGYFYLVSKKFLVREFCQACKESNASENLEHFKRRHCENCVVDSDFFNLVCLLHKFDGGSAALFLSQDQIHRLSYPKVTEKKVYPEKAKEKFFFKDFHFDVQNLDVIELDSYLKLHRKLLGLK